MRDGDAGEAVELVCCGEGAQGEESFLGDYVNVACKFPEGMHGGGEFTRAQITGTRM